MCRFCSYLFCDGARNDKEFGENSDWHLCKRMEKIPKNNEYKKFLGSQGKTQEHKFSSKTESIFPERGSDNIHKCQYILQSDSSLALWTLSRILAKGVGGGVK